MKRQVLTGVVVLGVAFLLAVQARANEYVVWTEPNEGAFSFVAPKGWTVRGGLTRPVPLAVTTEVEMISPDGQIYIKYSERNPMCIEPYGTYAMYKVGTVVNPGFGPAVVAPYKSGTDYLAGVVLPARGKNVRLTEKQDITRLFPPSQVPGLVYNVGESMYTFQRPDGSACSGAAFATTWISRGQLVSLWQAASIAVIEAPESRMKEAWATYIRGLVTTTPNLRWAASQSATIMKQSGILSQANQQVSNIINNTYWSRQATMSQVFKKYDDAVRGTVDLYDASTGSFHYGVQNSYNYYFVNNQGQIAGNNTGSSPGANFKPLTRLP